jgi:hypothetical protein
MRSRRRLFSVRPCLLLGLIVLGLFAEGHRAMASEPCVTSTQAEVACEILPG